MAKGTKSAVVVVKKKRWIPILAPKLFNEQMIGESYVSEPQELNKRCVSVSLMILTGDPQKQNTSLKFRVTGVGKDGVNTELIGYRILPFAAKKMMRRGRNKIDDSFLLQTGDKRLIRIKPIIVTRGRTTGGVMASMRKLVRAYLARALSKMEFDQIVREVVERKLQHGLMIAIKKIYPVSTCEIREFFPVTAEKVKEMGWVVMTPPAEPPKPEPKEAEKVEQKEEKAEAKEEKESATVQPTEQPEAA